MIYNDGQAGFLTTIIGPMFSEKSGELIKRCRLAKSYQKKNVIVFKPSFDNRYAEDEIVSRIGLRIEAIKISKNLANIDWENQIFVPCENAHIVAFDEAQFFSNELEHIVKRMLKENRQVVVAGLNLDYLGRPFGVLDKLLLFSDEIVVKSAFCAKCGRPAMYTQRLLGGKAVTSLKRAEDIVLIGDEESYEPRCRLCFEHD